MLDSTARTTTMAPTSKTSHEIDDGFKTIRYGLQGALLFVALIGIYAWARGIETRQWLDIAAAAFGFLVVIVVRAIGLRSS